MVLGTSIVNIFGRDAMATQDGRHDAPRADRRSVRAGPGRVARPPRAEAARPRLREAADADARVPRGLRAAALPRAGLTAPDGQPIGAAPAHRRLATADAGAGRHARPMARCRSSSLPRAWPGCASVLDERARPTGPRPVLAHRPGRGRRRARPRRRRAPSARAWMAPYCRAENYQSSLAEQGFGAGRLGAALLRPAHRRDRGLG